MAKISWHISKDDETLEYEDHYAGAFNRNDEIIISIQVWNNKSGGISTDHINNAYLRIEFKDIEESILFNYMTISVGKNDFAKPDVFNGKAEVELGSLLGNRNDGIANIKNKDNYKNIDIKISNIPNNIKTGLRNMVLDIVGE